MSKKRTLTGTIKEIWKTLNNEEYSIYITKGKQYNALDRLMKDNHNRSNTSSLEEQFIRVHKSSHNPS